LFGVLPQFFLRSRPSILQASPSDQRFFRFFRFFLREKSVVAGSTRETIRRIMKENFFLYRGRTEEPPGGARKNGRTPDRQDWLGERAEEELRKN